jgi:hypothetical protein
MLPGYLLAKFTSFDIVTVVVSLEILFGFKNLLDQKTVKQGKQ